jgi:hypothetical protein
MNFEISVGRLCRIEVYQIFEKIDELWLGRGEGSHRHTATTVTALRQPERRIKRLGQIGSHQDSYDEQLDRAGDNHTPLKLFCRQKLLRLFLITAAELPKRAKRRISLRQREPRRSLKQTFLISADRSEKNTI